MLQKNKYKVVLQKYDYDCGVAASCALLINSGVKVNYEILGKKLKVSPAGVPASKIVIYFKTLKILEPKLKLNSKIKDLRKELKEGRICMVAYQSWGKKNEQEELMCGHYSVAVAVSGGKVYLLDPTAYKDWGDGVGWRVMKVNDFEEKWIDKENEKVLKGWMLSVKPRL